MTTSQVTTWRRYTQAEKKAYQERLRKRSKLVFFEGMVGPIPPWQRRALILVVGAS